MYRDETSEQLQSTNQWLHRARQARGAVLNDCNRHSEAKSGWSEDGACRDPRSLATGVLVAAMGKATKSIARIMDTTKRYETRIDLSAFTQTDDREGAREEVHVPDPPSIESVEQALDRFRGASLQRPPAYSAMKVGGRRAYQLARSGKEPSLEPRPVTAHEIRIQRYEWPFLELDLHVEKGFYVRSLARELGTRLETGDTANRYAGPPWGRSPFRWHTIPRNWTTRYPSTCFSTSPPRSA